MLFGPKADYWQQPRTQAYSFGPGQFAGSSEEPMETFEHQNFLRRGPPHSKQALPL